MSNWVFHPYSLWPDEISVQNNGGKGPCPICLVDYEMCTDHSHKLYEAIGLLAKQLHPDQPMQCETEEEFLKIAGGGS